MSRVHRNFWVLVSATVVAVGLLSTAVRMPSGALAGVLTAVSGAAAAVSLALAGRILVVLARAETARRARLDRAPGEPSVRTGPSGWRSRRSGS